ncbi:MAG: ketopantoate reductase family protein [Deltaproteobacteria bacterium]|nr:ketopantoate reductase family protein [Candidatus Zymogenaceae bacterium]
MNHIVIYGAGAIGATVGGWLYPHHPSVTLLARGEHAERMKKDGLVVRLRGEKTDPLPIRAPVITGMYEEPEASLLIIAVKNYGLEAACQEISGLLGSDVTVVGLQNGVENQEILPKYFERVVYGVVWYNAWIESPGVACANKKGPIVLGVTTDDPEAIALRDETAALLSRGMDIETTDRLVDAVHSKLVLNLTNAVLTLVGHGFREIESTRTLKHIMTGALLEGIDIVKRAGYSEYQFPKNPGWGLMRLISRLPEFISDMLFKKSLQSFEINSMGQDVLQIGRADTELESLTGYILGLADDFGIAAPINRTVYELCRREFGKPIFTPMSEAAVWELIQARIEEDERS